VNHSDLVGLLEDAITGRGGRWAELGAGEGNFTLALADLLGPGAHITAVDRDSGALKTLAEQMGRRFPNIAVEIEVADFTRRLRLSGLYGTNSGNPWVPHPFTFERWEKMAAQAGFVKTRLLRTIPSRYTGSMYSAVSYVSSSANHGI